MPATQVSEPSPTILIVDDDPDIRWPLRLLLEHVGYCVDEARDGRAAIEALRRAHAPSLVLLDLQMPFMDGWQVLTWLRSNERLRDLRVIVFSAWDQVFPVPPGACAFIQKPAEIADILRVIAAHCPVRWAPSRV